MSLSKQRTKQVAQDIADYENHVEGLRTRAAAALADDDDEDAARLNAAVAFYEAEIADLRAQLATGVALAPAARAPTAATTSKPRAFDRGDQVVELMDAQRENRAPAAWATTPIDDGDLLMQADLERDRRHGRKPAQPATSASRAAPPAPPNFDVGDQIVELDNARREGRAPAAWATVPARPAINTSRVDATRIR